MVSFGNNTRVNLIEAKKGKDKYENCNRIE